MITLVASVVLAQGFAQGYEGVWITNSGEPITVLNSVCAQAFKADRYYSIYALKQTPQGGILGEYMAADDASSYPRLKGAVESWFEASVYKNRQDKNKSKPTDFLSWQYEGLNVVSATPIVVAKKASDIGSAEIYYGKADPYGKITYLDVKAVDARGTAKIQGQAHYALKPSEITVGGKFSDGKTTVELADGGGTTSEIRGTLTRGDSPAYLLQGSRIGSRACYYLANGKTGKMVGMGTLEWAPTTDRALKIKVKDTKKTDRLLLNYESPETSGPARVYVKES